MMCPGWQEELRSYILLLAEAARHVCATVEELPRLLRSRPSNLGVCSMASSYKLRVWESSYKPSEEHTQQKSCQGDGHFTRHSV